MAAACQINDMSISKQSGVGHEQTRRRMQRLLPSLPQVQRPLPSLTTTSKSAVELIETRAFLDRSARADDRWGLRKGVVPSFCHLIFCFGFMIFLFNGVDHLRHLVLLIPLIYVAIILLLLYLSKWNF